MAVRVRTDGRILCAATHPRKWGDTYLHDGLHYQLSVELRVLVTEPMDCAGGRGGHGAHGEWWWRNEIPGDAAIDPFYLEPAGFDTPKYSSFIPRWPNRVLQARVRRLEIMVDAAFKEAERYRELYLLDHPEQRNA